MTDPAGHWSSVYAHGVSDAVSWYEPDPTVSRRLLTAFAPRDAAVIDVGAGASTLVDALIRDGWADLTLLDVTDEPFGEVRERLGVNAEQVCFVTGDVTNWSARRQYDVWHDRAVFHFLVTEEEARAYAAVAATAVHPGGVIILGTFAPDGPDACSGLPTARYDAEGLADVFADAFTLEHAEQADHVTPTGTLQPFTWVVLRRLDSAATLPSAYLAGREHP